MKCLVLLAFGFVKMFEINKSELLQWNHHSIQKLTDVRKYPKYKTAQIIIPLLFAFMLRIKSMKKRIDV